MVGTRVTVRAISLTILLLLSSLIFTSCKQQSAAEELVGRLFDNELEDRSVFRAGLIDGEERILEQLSEASVYHIDIQISSDLTSIEGRQQVLYTNQEKVSLDEIYFNLYPNLSGGRATVQAVQVDKQGVEINGEARGGALRIPLTNSLKPGEHVIIQMDFQVQLPEGLGGHYGLLSYTQDVLMLDKFYPVIPVYDDEGWHIAVSSQIGDTTHLDVSYYLARISARSDLVLLTSGVEISNTREGETQVSTHMAGPSRDFYVTASERFSSISTKMGQTTVNSYALDDKIEEARYALDTAVNALAVFSRRLGAYPYTELDVVGLPMMEGILGIEYPGIVGVNQEIYNQSIMLEGTVVHEVGHQWFYNIIGSNQMTEPWLDESLVQYSTGLYFMDMYGEAAWLGVYNSWIDRWNRVGKATIPIGLPVASYTPREYGAIVYGRGPLFIDALASEIGQSVLDDFLLFYTQSYKWGIVTTDTFKTSVEQHCKCDLTSLFLEWVYSQ